VAGISTSRSAILQNKEFHNLGDEKVELQRKVRQCLFSYGRYNEVETLFLKHLRIIRYKDNIIQIPWIVLPTWQLYTILGGDGRGGKAGGASDGGIQGPEHPNPLASTTNLASAYQQQEWSEWIKAEIRNAGGAGDGGKKESTGTRASRHPDQHGQPSISVQEPEAMDGGGKAERAGGGDIQDGTETRAPFHTDQHGQLGIYIRESRAMVRGGKAERASDGNIQGTRASRHSDYHG
jgi:hypothetical protein